MWKLKPATFWLIYRKRILPKTIGNWRMQEQAQKEYFGQECLSREEKSAKCQQHILSKSQQ